MTLFYPDISSYETGISLAGMALVMVKATEGTSYTNPDYHRVVGDAHAAGIPLATYHFLHQGNAQAQAQHCLSVVGAGVPLMIDVEIGANSTPTLADTTAFADAYRQMGGNPRLVYLPHWYWQDHIGSPSLAPLVQRGLLLVSSDYTTYSDTGPGWIAYGGMTPTVWQYTDAHALNGFSVDMNAYRGTLDQFVSLLEGNTMDWTDQIPDTNHAGRTYANVFADLEELRCYLMGETPANPIHVPPADSPLGKLLSLSITPPSAADIAAQIIARLKAA